ncbi:uncharacterized protein nhsl1a isoform X2 [Stigmatopora argus]
MISYVDCLGGDGTGNRVASQCWNSRPDEDRDQLLPRKIAPLQPKTEGSLRRRLLTAKIHQHHEAIWGRNAGVAGWPPSDDKRPLPPHPQQRSPWYVQRQSPQPRIYTSLPAGAPGKAPFAVEFQSAHSHPVSRPAVNQWRRTSSCPPTPEPRPGYTLPKVASPTREFEVPPQYGYEPSRRPKRKLFGFKKKQQKETTPLLPTARDGDRWSIQYTTQKSQQALLFVPAKRPHASTGDLQAYSEVAQYGASKPSTSLLCTPNPSSSSWSHQSESRGHRRWRDKSRKMSSASSDEEETVILDDTRPLTPLVLNPIELTSCWDVFACETELRLTAEPIPKLPTPEERMRQQANAVTTEIVPIDVTGQSFDRQASFRKVAGNTDSSTRSSRNLSRCSTGAENSIDVIEKQDLPVDEWSTASSQQQEEEELVRKKKESLSRKIRAPRGDGISSLMMSLTSTRVHGLSSLPRMATSSSLESDTSCDSISYRTLSASSSRSQDFPSDLQPLLLSDLRTRHQYPSPRPLKAPSCLQTWGTTCSLDLGDKSPIYSPYCSPFTSIGDAGSQDGGPNLSPCVEWSSINHETSSVSVVSSECSSPCNFESVYSEDESSFPSRNRLRSPASSSSCRSISLRKSKRPPPPPLRYDSLQRRLGRSKSSRSPQSSGFERSLCSPTQPLHDPWVPRSLGERHQNGIDCGTVMTFEPLSVDHQTLSTQELSPNLGSNVALMPGSPASKSEERHLHSDSPSASFSSQSNNLLKGTLPGAFPPPQNSPFFYPCTTATPLSLKELEAKPMNRRSSISSSFSSTSSLSSCSSSNSSVQRAHPPAQLLPNPPPLPPSPLHSLSLHPKPLPPSSIPPQCSHFPSSSHPPPPPLPPSFLHPSPPLDPPLPPFTSPQLSSLLPPPTFPTSSSYPTSPSILHPSSPLNPLQETSLYANPLLLPSPPPPPPHLPPLPPLSSPFYPGPSKPSSLHPIPLPPSHFVSAAFPLQPAHVPAPSLPPPPALPPPPPLPPSSHFPCRPHLPPSSHLPPPFSLSPSLPPSSLPPSPLPSSLGSRPPPPPYSHAVKRSSHPAALFFTSPTLAYQPPEFCSPQFIGTSQNPGQKQSTATRLLVTAQALQSIKLRSITNQQVIPPNGSLVSAEHSDAPGPDVALSHHGYVNTKQRQSGIEESVFTHNHAENQEDQSINVQIYPAVYSRLENNPRHESSCVKTSYSTSGENQTESQLLSVSLHGPEDENHQLVSDFTHCPCEFASSRKKSTLPKKPYLSIQGVKQPLEYREDPKGERGMASIASDPDTKCFPGHMLHSDRQCLRRMMKSLGEHEDQDKNQRRTTMFAATKKEKPRKKRRPIGRHLLMMAQSRLSSSPSTSSSSSSDEEAESERREGKLCAPIVPRSLSLSSVLSSDNLQGVVSLNDLLIEEQQEEEEEDVSGEMDPGGHSDGMLVPALNFTSGSAGPRTTEDLFTAIHRSKQKMFGRRGSSGRISADDRPRPTPQTFAGHGGKRQSKSESFKALLLRKGSRLQPSSRLSAVERLRVATPSAASGPLDGHVQDMCFFQSLCTVNSHLAFDISRAFPDVTTSLATKQSLFPLFSLPVFVPSTRQPRAHAASRSASCRFLAHQRHFAGPMTAIYESEGE